MSEESLRHYLTQVSEMMKEVRAVEGYRYQSMEEFLLAEGTFYSAEPLTAVEEEILRRVLRLTSGPFKTKECYANALRLVMASEMLRGVDLRYAEGYAQGAVIPVIHAWVVLNGKPIDVTWGENMIGASHNRLRSIAKMLERIKYNLASHAYCGFTVPLKAVYRRAAETGLTPTFLDDWENHYPLLRDGLPKEWRQLKPPKWAVDLLAKVAKDEGRENIPTLVWKRTESYGTAGFYSSLVNLISIQASRIADPTKAELLVLLHEIAHWLADRCGHSPEFWDKAWELYHRYGVDIGYARVREQYYRTASVAAYHRYQNGEKYQEWRPKGEPTRLADFADGDYIVCQLGKRYGRRSWYYGWVRQLFGSGATRYFEDTEGTTWNLAVDTEAWPARRRAERGSVA